VRLWNTKDGHYLVPDEFRMNPSYLLTILEISPKLRPMISFTSSGSNLSGMAVYQDIFEKRAVTYFRSPSIILGRRGSHELYFRGRAIPNQHHPPEGFFRLLQVRTAFTAEFLSIRIFGLAFCSFHSYALHI
jgi:hypothetical protein